MISLKNIQLNLEGKPILKGISFKIKKGEVIAIIGKSGAGKSSLLKIMGGYLQQFQGQIRFQKQNYIGPTNRLLPGLEDVSIVNQDFTLDIYHTVRENVLLKMEHLPKEIRESFAEELLLLLELHEIADQQAIKCSGGEQQRLSIARALASEPQVLLLDESMVHLDGYLRKKIMDYIFQLNKIRKTTLCFVSHQIDEIIAHSDRIFYLKDGKIEKNLTPREMFYQMEDLTLAALFGPVNRVKLNGLWIFFRPDEYSLEGIESQRLKLEFKRETFYGAYHQSEFQVNGKERILLNSIKSIAHVTDIYIEKKNEAFNG